MIDRIIAVALNLMNPEHLRNWFTALLNYGMIRAKIREGTRKWFLRFWWGIGTSPNF